MNRAVLVSFGLGLATALYAWTTPERIDRRPDGDWARMPAVAVDRDAVIHAVWAETREYGVACRLMYACRTDDTWSIPVNVGRDTGDIRVSRIAEDGTGRMLVVWSEEGRARLRYVRQSGDTWTLPKLAFANNGIEPRLAVDSRRRVHLIFEEYTGRGGIWYSRFDETADSWLTPVRIASGGSPLGNSDLVVDRFDRLHAVWMNWGTNGVDYARMDDTGWTAATPVPDPVPASQSVDPNLGVDAAGEPVVIWQERAGDYWPCFVRRSGGEWEAPESVPVLEGYGAVVEVDTANRTHLICGGTVVTFYSVRTDTGWAVPVPVCSVPMFDAKMLESRGEMLLAWVQPRGMAFLSRQTLYSGVKEPADRYGRPGVPKLATWTGSRMTFYVPRAAVVRVALWDASGRSLMEQTLGFLQPGLHKFEVPAASFVRGVVFARLEMDRQVQMLKTVLVR